MPDERKLATVLFADLSGSTALADDQDPERTRARLERFYDAMAAEIEAAGGTVEKFAGDAVMAAFGAPEALEDHAERALHAALSMQRNLQSGLALRIGVNTGEVVAGRPRAGSSFVSGDAVNVAARLEQAAEPGEILAGERTVAAARGAFEFGERRTVDAKGKPGGVACRAVVRALSLMRPRGYGGLARAFVGRDAELQRLRAAYTRVVEQRRSTLVTILGDAGVGKTRLLRELWEQLDEPVRLTGRCLPYGEGITFWPLAEVLKEQLGIMESDPPEDVRRRLGEREILGLTLGLDVAGDLHPLAVRDRLQAAWVEHVNELVAEKPLVLLVEDLHWAEPPLLELLDRIAREADGPLLLLATARPDFSPAWHPRIDGETIWLEPLAAADTASLVEALAAQLPSTVREMIVHRAEGNPFFVEELIQLARENGRRDPDDIPDSVQAVLAARIDGLAQADKAALQAAAVIGRAFWTGPVYELVEELEPDLHLLESRDLIRRRSGSSLPGEVEYVFKHALTRDVAYGGLTKGRRARLHARFADWLHGLGGGRDEHASLLAHHYAEAVRPEDADLVWEVEPEERERLRREALLWLERAADLAVHRYELDDAVALLHRALDLQPDDLHASALWRKIGLANALKFDGEAFWTAMQRSLAVCKDRETCAETYGDLALQTSIRSGIWPTRPDRELVQGWIEETLKLAPAGSRARVKALVADCFWNQSRGREAAEEASALAERIGDLDLRAHAFGARTWMAFAEGRYDEALTWSERTLELVEQLNDPDHIADVYEHAIPVACAAGRFGEARKLAGVHRRVVEPLTAHHRLHGISVTLEVEELGASWERILGYSDETVALVEDNVSTPCIRNARSLLVTALAALETGDPEAAAALEHRADELTLRGYDFVLAAPRARLALARGDVDGALSCVATDTALRIGFALANICARLDVLAAAGERDTLEREARDHLHPRTYVEPFALRALGLVREDDELLRQASDRFASLGLHWHAERTRTVAES